MKNRKVYRLLVKDWQSNQWEVMSKKYTYEEIREEYIWWVKSLNTDSNRRIKIM